MDYIRELLNSRYAGNTKIEIIIASIVLYISLITTMYKYTDKHRNTENSMLVAPAYLLCIMYIIKTWYPNAQINKFIIWLIVANTTTYIIMCKNHVYHNLKYKTGYSISTMSIVWNITVMILVPILNVALMFADEFVNSYQQLNIVKNIQIILAVYNFMCLLDLIYSSDVPKEYEEHTECHTGYIYVVLIVLIYAFFQLSKADTTDNVILMLLMVLISLISVIIYLLYVMYNTIRYKQ